MASISAKELGLTGERMIPELHKNRLIYAEHAVRYIATQNITSNKIVVDIACGSGYGTSLLAKKAKKVYGVDIDKKTIQYATKNYGADNIEFLVGDGEKIPIDDGMADIVVTFETIEHIKNYKKFIKEIKRILKPDGLMIISTPNDLEFAEGNHYHLHEFKYNELIKLIKKDFKNIQPYFQATWKFVSLGTAEQLSQEKAKYDDFINAAKLNPDQYLYFFLLCSNRKISEKISSVGMLGEHYSDRYLIGQEMQREQNEENYKMVVSELQVKYNDMVKYAEELQDDLKKIRASKSYKYAAKLHIIKNKISGTNSKTNV